MWAWAKGRWTSSDPANPAERFTAGPEPDVHSTEAQNRPAAAYRSVSAAFSTPRDQRTCLLADGLMNLLAFAALPATTDDTARDRIEKLEGPVPPRAVRGVND